MARRKKGRSIHGVLLLDKPQGMTSNDVLQKVKVLFNAQKAGHTGALDPLATGMLPICFGEATKFSQYLLDADKRYRVVAHLGIRTNTSDADGQIIAQRAVNISETDILQALNHFRYDVMQIPTMFSALKHQGRPLYEYARMGITIERAARPITIYENRLVNFNNNQLELDIYCSKGTYIRTIIDDLGELLGCGAHVIDLRRLQVSKYPTEKMVSLAYIQNNSENTVLLDSLLMSVDSPAVDYEKIIVSNEQGNDILLGRQIILNGSHINGSTYNKGQLVRIYQQETFIGMGEINIDECTGYRLSPKRLINTEG